jgi:hypothetical protein
MDLTTDVLFADGKDNMGGITKRAYIVFLSSLLTVAKPVANPSTYAARVTIEADHVLKTGKKLIEVSVLYDKSGVESPSVGMRKGMSSKPKMTLVAAGNEADMVGLIDLLKNSDCLTFAEPQEEDGDHLIQIGTEGLPASLTSYAISTGTGPEGEKTCTMVFEAPSRAPYYFYKGDLPRIGA